MHGSTAFSQEKAEGDVVLERLVNWTRNLRDFESEYTREKVYLHLDNNAYFEEETIWFKAYLLRASTLCPSTDMSKVLYVDLLNANGELVEHKILKVDENGQAEGEFELKSPIKTGYYEIRAYTRAMTNWSTEVCYSRVIPVFPLEDKEANVGVLSIDIPEKKWELPFGHSRPMNLDSRKDFSLNFFPEGGNRVEGLSQRIAYQLQNGKGNAVDEVIKIYDESGTFSMETASDAEGMGSFVLPPFPINTKVFARVGTKTFELPHIDPSAHYSLSATPDEEGVTLLVSANPRAETQLLGVYISCRALPCYFDTLTVAATDQIEMTIPNEILKDGINTVYLFNDTGHSLAQRLVWKSPTKENVDVLVRQNEREYEAFSPVALELELSDNASPVPSTTFSVSVRDAASELVAVPGVNMATELLLSSEVRGYIHHPEQYFTVNDDAHRRALDLLLMIQGWTADDFEVMDGAEAFPLKEPVEDKLLLTGCVLKDNEKAVPWPNLSLHLQMYSLEGGSLEGDVVTDAEGKFAFGSNVNYCGEWIAQITTKETVTNRKGEEKQKKRYSRVAFDRWFAPALRPFDSAELILQEPQVSDGLKSDLDDADLFEWEDTIPRVLMSQELHEAVVVHHNKYRGFIGNRYSYFGGESAGMRHAHTYFNLVQAVEKRKDAGRGEATIWELLYELTHGDSQAYFSSIDASVNGDAVNQGGYDEASAAQDKEVAQNANPYEKAPMSQKSENAEETQQEESSDTKNDADKMESFNITINGVHCYIFLNNDLIGNGRNESIFLQENTSADEFKSAILMTEYKDWVKFWPGFAGPPPSGKHYGLFLYERPDYYRYMTKRGVDKRMIQGFNLPKKFYNPQYNGIDVPDAEDYRRTLCWNPNVTTDANGHASVVFFSNAADNQKLKISVRGVTSDGHFIYFER